MTDKQYNELIKQLTRIANALEKLSAPSAQAAAGLRYINDQYGAVTPGIERTWSEGGKHWYSRTTNDNATD